MPCKGTCHKFHHNIMRKGGIYANGNKRCQVCEIFINYNGLRCPCCRYRLRTKPRNKRYKEKLRELQNDKHMQEHM